MKIKSRHFMLAIAALLLLLAVSGRPLLLSLVKGQISGYFKGSKVSLQNCSLWPPGVISFSAIRISKHPVYDFKLQNLTVNYSPFSLLKGKVNKVIFNNPDFSLKLAGPQILRLTDILELRKSGGFSPTVVQVHGARIKIESEDVNLNADISLNFNLPKQTVDSCELYAGLLKMKLLRLEGVCIFAKQNKDGFLEINTFEYGKLKINNTTGKVLLKEKNAILQDLSALLFSGNMDMDVNIVLGKELGYESMVKFRGIDLEKIIGDFSLGEKFSASGKFYGSVMVKGRANVLELISGNFSSEEPGGELTIKDSSLLKNLALSSRLDVGILMESFTDYNYNKGVAVLSLENHGSELVLGINLSGPAGKRELTITLHDFNNGR